ncbi:DUF2271 domain-containing protein [Sandaracinomonas limnophila]|uniref:FAD:protein FMN transferase n=1 Tax=Sandaracinomonas limnophila TaxID=1862386 RepID=A0A437PXY8_9BACT|nr:DUF2271 domain-containing protein [Sandaracinomonas limnophila]RVU27078.1 DUF2271 domain-containing protein [Sandaracinomonas limnophila]
MTNFALLAASLLNLVNNQSGTLVSHFENVLGTSLSLKIKADNQLMADHAEEQIIDYVKQLQNNLGSFLPGQGLYEFNNSSSKQIVNNDLKEVMVLFDNWSELTNGTIASQTNSLKNLWLSAEEKQILPSETDLKNVVASISSNAWEFDGEYVSKLAAGDIRLHSLAKGYVLEKAAEFALSINGVTGISLNIGGDILVKGDMSEFVKIANPSNSEENSTSLGVVELKNQAIASSGNYKDGFDINGVHYSHIFDPKTGYPADQIIGSTIIHENAITAGAIATAANVMSPQETEELAKSIGEVEYLLAEKDGNIITSTNWNAKTENVSSSISFVNLKEKSWNPNLVLQINLELADLGGYARRPYVAIWVEDEDHKPVRRLAVWYRKPRWLPDLREFSNSLRDVNMDVYSITSATRSAGQYNLIWDGKNDQGEFVPQGNYTVFIESAREHGPYELMKQVVKCDDKFKSVAYQPNGEISSASLVLKNK